VPARAHRFGAGSSATDLRNEPGVAFGRARKRADRRLARKCHPDVSKEPDAGARFKEVAEAQEALIDVERRAACDEIAQRHDSGRCLVHHGTLPSATRCEDAA